MSKAKASAKRESSKKPTKSSSSSWFSVLALVALLIAVAAVILPRNPTQKLGMLISLMRGGLPGGENTTEFDGIYSNGNLKGNEQQKKKKDADVANSFYNLATKFYEYGWGDSFHFGWRLQGEGHQMSIKNSQNFVAQKLRVRDMDPVLDLGCGIGGPLRGVVRATGANVTGVTINEHQVARAREITSALPEYMRKRCHYMVNDYLDIKGLEPNSFEAAFYMESSLHCENRTKTFTETFRLLKPGGRLVAMEYFTLPAWNPDDPAHSELMKKHLHGNGAARTPSIEEGLKMIRDAGFVIEEHFDFMAIGEQLYGDQARYVRCSLVNKPSNLTIGTGARRSSCVCFAFRSSLGGAICRVVRSTTGSRLYSLRTHSYAKCYPTCWKPSPLLVSSQMACRALLSS